MLSLFSSLGDYFKDSLLTRFLNPNESEISYHYLLVNIVLFLFLLRISLAFDYLKREPSQKKRTLIQVLKSVFSKSVFTSRSFLMDIAIYSVNLLIFGVISYAMASIFANASVDNSINAVAEFLLRYGPHIKLHVSVLMENVIFTGLLFLIYETLYYFSHRAFHQFDFLWQFHKVHHSATHLNFMTDNRFHTIEWAALSFIQTASVAVAKVMCLYIFSGNPELAIFNGVAIHYAVLYTLTLAQHSNLWLTFGPFEYVVLSPAMHILHHSTNPETYNTNYALNLSTLDYLFGTFKKTEKQPPENLEIGVNPEEQVFWSQAPFHKYFLHPFSEIRKALSNK